MQLPPGGGIIDRDLRMGSLSLMDDDIKAEMKAWAAEMQAKLDGLEYDLR